MQEVHFERAEALHQKAERIQDKAAALQDTAKKIIFAVLVVGIAGMGLIVFG